MSSTRHRILIVEDEAIVREDLRDMLHSVGYEVVGALMSGAEAVARVEVLRPDLVLMDIRLRGDMDGIDAACRIRRVFPVPVVFLTAFADETTIQRAKTATPFGYLTKPLQERALRATIEVALHRYAEGLGSGRVISTPPAEVAPTLLGESDVMHSVRRQIVRLAPADITVLVEGETGTGKELAARALHRESGRRDGPFLAVNCAALTETLASAELFGHRRGAFTGAHQDHRGVFEAASGGTVFLDEIGDIPRSQQPHLLRVLEERVVTRVGEPSPRPIDVRILAATHRDLEGEVREGRFRADLFYRIRVGRLVLPPLRDRLEDVPMLAKWFLDAFSRQLGRRLPHLSVEAVEALQRHDWPGNIRELRNTVEFAALRCEGERIQPLDLPGEVQTLESSSVEGPEGLDRMRTAIERAGGNRSEAARLLGISRATLYRRLGEGFPRSE